MDCHFGSSKMTHFRYGMLRFSTKAEDDRVSLNCRLPSHPCDKARSRQALLATCEEGWSRADRDLRRSAEAARSRLRCCVRAETAMRETEIPSEICCREIKAAHTTDSGFQLLGLRRECKDDAVEETTAISVHLGLEEKTLYS